MNERPQAAVRSAFPIQREVLTRWMDNDVYGHVNNVVYYAYFDTAVNAHLIEHGVLGAHASHNAIGLVVETHCTYFASASFPEPLTVGLRVAHTGTSSVRYELAIFRQGGEHAIVQGHFVHVYVDRNTRRPVTALPAGLKEVLTGMKV